MYCETLVSITSHAAITTIILINADHLTIDAQSALRRCIEQFSFKARSILNFDFPEEVGPDMVINFLFNLLSIKIN